MLNTRNSPQVNSFHNLSINSDVLVFCKGNLGFTDKWTVSFKFLEIINRTCKINLPSELTNFRTTVVKFYLIRLKYDDPNNTLSTEQNDQKNVHEENHTFTASLIASDSIFAVVLTSSIAADLSNNSPNNHDYEIV